ncbi:uncharacterized protein LOC131144862 isoform X2 [Malania oleifera]|uniref:uncharacterized protein LOC131144862 isoform X2 n=1 Tax=Malania oleifera TaxID=397392 RepID=UPI0025ADA614|nr:uncharacterized protein LOC131144862 isoform X2 [Malania oleifera]
MEMMEGGIWEGRLRLQVLIVILLGFSHLICVINGVPLTRTRNLENLSGDHNIVPQSGIHNAPQKQTSINKELGKAGKGVNGNYAEGRFLEQLFDYSVDANKNNHHRFP